MFWGYIHLFKSLSKLQHLVVFITTFAIPVSFDVVQGWRDTGLCLSCVNWGELALYFVWYQTAMLVIASATRRDRARARESLDRMFLELTGRVSQLSEEHHRKITGIQDRVRDLQNWVRDMRQALNDELKVDLPPLTHSLRANFRAGVSTLSVNVTVDSQTGWRVRLLRWCNRRARNLQRWGRRILVGWEDGGDQSKSD